MLASAIMAALAPYPATRALAQTPPAPKSTPSPKGAPAAQPKAPPPPTTPAARPAPPQPEAQNSEPQLVYSPWTKFCEKAPGGRQVCFVVSIGQDQSGTPVITVTLAEPEGYPQKTLRVTVPLGMQIAEGVRTVIDQGQPMSAPYVLCLMNGCSADYEASADLISRLKTGQGLLVQSINYLGDQVSYTLPLAGFALSYDGPPSDPKFLAEQQKKLEEELQKRAAEARKKLESPPAR
jgi:invasion protein IalB